MVTRYRSIDPDVAARLHLALTDNAPLVLTHWLSWLGLDGRGYYIAAGSTAEVSAAGLSIINELVMEIASQLRRLNYETEPAYSDELFIKKLEGRMGLFDQRFNLQQSIVSVLNDLGY